VVGGGGNIQNSKNMNSNNPASKLYGGTLNTHQLIGYLSENYVYDPQIGVLYPKENTRQGLQPIDVLAMLESDGNKLSFETLKNALNSSSMTKVSSLKLLMESLPEWDNKDHIGEFCKYVDTTDNARFEEFLRLWMTSAVGMVLEPSNNQAVNRLVFCVQSTQQRIGKTSMARWLGDPFNTEYSSALKEFDSPDNSKDAKLDLTNNLIVVIDDIDNWHSKGVKRLKSIISARNIKVRPPYGLRSIDAARTASFFATTNSSGFLNEPGDTRWVVFELVSIDWKGYTSTLDAVNLWSQAKHYWTSDSSHKYLSQAQVEYCTSTAVQYQVKPETDPIIESYVKIDPQGRITPLDIYQAMSVSDRRLLGAPDPALGKIGSAIGRLFGNDVKRFINGKKYYRLQIIKAYTKRADDFAAELLEEPPF
jgi:predicted P-loop ATPase